MKDNNQKNDEKKKHGSAFNEVREDGGRQNASANQGGTTDMDSDSLVAGRTNESKRGSGLTTKRNVTGSDYDGQAS